jgi:hypothetical protein
MHINVIAVTVQIAEGEFDYAHISVLRRDLLFARCCYGFMLPGARP